MIKFCKLSCQSLNVESIKLISQIYSLKQDSEAKILFKVLLSYLSPFSLATDPELKAAGQLLQSQKFSSYQPIFDIFTPWQPSWDELKSFIDDKAKFIEHKATLIINSIEQALSSQNQSLATEMAVQLSYLYNLKVDNLTNSNCLNPLAWIKLLGQTKSLPNITLAKKILKSCPDSKEIKLGSLLIFQALNCIDKGAARDLFIDLHQSSILDRKDPQNIICLNLLYKTKTDFETSEFKKLCAEIYAAATEKNQKILTQKIKFLSPGSVPLKINEILTLIEIEPGRIDSNQIHLEIKAQLKQVPSNYRYICQLFFIALKLESSSALRGSIIKVIANDNFPVDIADSYLISTLELIFKQPLPAKSLKFALKVYRHISDSAAHLSLIEAVILACSNELKESQIFIGFLKKYGLKTRASNQIFNLLLTFKNSPDIEYLKSILSAHIDEIDHLQIDSVNKPYFINLVNDFQCSHAAHLQYLIKNSLLQELTIENFYHLILTLEEKLFELNAFNLCEILTSYSAAEWQKKFKNDPNFTPIINKFLAHLIHNWSNQRYSLLCEFIKIAENRPNQFSINEEYFAVFKCLVEKNSCISIYDYFLKNNQNYISARCLKNLQPVIKEILNLTNTEHVQGYHLSCLIDLAIKADLYKYFLCLSIHKIISTSVKGLEKHIVYFLENCEIKQEKIYYKTFDYILKRSKIIPYSWFITPPKSIGRLEISNQTGVEQKLYNLAKAYIKPTLSQEKLVDKFLEVAINAICKEKNLDLFRQTVHAVCHFDLNKFESASLAKLGMLIVCQDYFLALIDKDLKTNAKSIINYILEKKEPTTHYKNFEEEVDKNLSILTKNHLLEIPLILILVNKNLENYIKKEFDKPSFELEVLREKVKIFSLCHNFINDQVHTNFIINFLSITYKYYSFTNINYF